MKILSIATFKDGGTKLIETDQGVYWMPAPLGNPQIDYCRLFKGREYFKGEAIQVTDNFEIFELMHLLATYADRFFYIQRACR